MDAEAVATSDRARLSLRRGYFVTGMLLLAYTFAFIDRVSLGLVIDPIRNDLHLNDTQVSLLAGIAFVICLVLFSFPFGRWIDRYNRRNAVAVGITLWSAAMVGCGLATNFWQLFLGRMTVGVGEASINPAAYSMIPDCFPPHRRSLAMAIYASGATLGGGLAVYIGSLLLSWAAETQPSFPILGHLSPWQVLFVGTGLPGLLVALAFILFVKDPPRQQVGSSSASFKEVLAYLRTHLELFVLTFGGFGGIAISNYCFTVWGPSYFMRVHSLSVTDVGLIMGLGFGVFGTLGMLLGGIWSDSLIKAGRPEAPIWVTQRVALIQIPFFVGAYLSPTATIAIVLFCCGMLCASMVGGLQGTMVQALTPNRMRGQCSAIFLTTVNLLGLGIAPTLTGLMTDYVFGGPQGTGKSLAVTTSIALVMTFVLLGRGMRLAHERATAILRD